MLHPFHSNAISFLTLNTIFFQLSCHVHIIRFCILHDTHDREREREKKSEKKMKTLQINGHYNFVCCHSNGIVNTMGFCHFYTQNEINGHRNLTWNTKKVPWNAEMIEFTGNWRNIYISIAFCLLVWSLLSIFFRVFFPLCIPCEKLISIRTLLKPLVYHRRRFLLFKRNSLNCFLLLNCQTAWGSVIVSMWISIDENRMI